MIDTTSGKELPRRGFCGLKCGVGSVGEDVGLMEKEQMGGNVRAERDYFRLEL